MAALSNLMKKRSHFSIFKEKFFSTTASASPLVDSPSFAQRLRDLPKDLPGTNIKKEVSQVLFNLIHALTCARVCLCSCYGHCHISLTERWAVKKSLSLCLILPPSSLPTSISMYRQSGEVEITLKFSSIRRSCQNCHFLFIQVAPCVHAFLLHGWLGVLGHKKKINRWDFLAALLALS